MRIRFSIRDLLWLTLVVGIELAPNTEGYENDERGQPTLRYRFLPWANGTARLHLSDGKPLWETSA